MKTENSTPLTLCEACTLMARETVSLLDGIDDTLKSATTFRNALATLNSMQDLGDDGALLVWVETELENSRRFAETGQSYENLVRLDTPLPLPNPAMQLDAVCAILQAAALHRCAPEQWETVRDAVRMLTEMDSLEDMIQDGFQPDGGFLTPEALQTQLENVQTALRKQTAGAPAREPSQT